MCVCRHVILLYARRTQCQHTTNQEHFVPHLPSPFLGEGPLLLIDSSDKPQHVAEQVCVQGWYLVPMPSQPPCTTQCTTQETGCSSLACFFSRAGPVYLQWVASKCVSLSQTFDNHVLCFFFHCPSWMEPGHKRKRDMAAPGDDELLSAVLQVPLAAA